MTMLQIVMPMGGLGQRFRDAGIDTPKPLIEVDGVPMFRKALDSFKQYPGGTQLIVVIREDDDDAFGLADAIRAASAEARIVRIDSNTRGAVETALRAESVLDPELPMVILDCDIAFESARYFESITAAAEAGSAVDGVLLSFPSREARYSYAETDETNRVIRTAEKDPISANALMGSYFFSRADTFINAGHALVARQVSATMPEFYVSLVFNILIAEGKRIELSTGTFYCFGTPGELADYVRTGEPIARG